MHFNYTCSLTGVIWGPFLACPRSFPTLSMVVFFLTVTGLMLRAMASAMGCYIAPICDCLGAWHGQP